MKLLPMLTIALLQNTRMNTRLFSSINNIDKPACNNCKFYKPEKYSSFDSTNSKCTFYGTKNLHTGEIEYSYATDCRKNETQCGQEGKLYEAEKLINIVKLRHHFTSNLNLYILFIFCASILSIKY